MKASIAGELLLLVGLLAVAYLLYTQQEQINLLELEVDRVRGAFVPVPAATEAEPKPQRRRKASDGA